MGSYLAGLLVAGIVVTGMLGLLSLGQDVPESAYHNRTETFTPAELIKLAEDAESKNRLDAILQLGETPGDLEITVPLLAKLTMDDQEFVRLVAGIALNEIGAEGAPYVRPLMESGDEKKMSQACSAIKEMGSGSKLFMPQLTRWLEGHDPAKRKMALFALIGAGKDTVEVMDLLVESLDDPDFNTQCMACRVLESLGPDAIPAEEALLDLLKTGNPSTRSWAAIALGAMGPTDRTDVAEILGNNLEAFTQVEKQRTLIGIAHLGPEASSIEGVVREFMNDRQKRVMPYAAYALWRITGKADESVKVLEKLFDDPSYCDDAIEMAGKMQSAAAPLVDTLAAKLNSVEDATRELAVVALGNIGPSAAQAKPKIEKLLYDDDALIRYATRQALKQIDADVGHHP